MAASDGENVGTLEWRVWASGLKIMSSNEPQAMSSKLWAASYEQQPAWCCKGPTKGEASAFCQPPGQMLNVNIVRRTGAYCLTQPTVSSYCRTNATKFRPFHSTFPASMLDQSSDILFPFEDHLCKTFFVLNEFLFSLEFSNRFMIFRDSTNLGFVSRK